MEAGIWYTVHDMFPFGGMDISTFLNQPLDQVINQLVWMFGWVPMVIVFAMGIMRVWVEIQRKHWRTKRPYILMAIDVPRLTEQSPKAVENIFAMTTALKSSPSWIEKYLQGKNQWRHSFEITSINGYIQFYIWTEERFRDPFEAAIYAQYPDAEIALVEDYTQAVPQSFPNDDYDMWGSEYVLSKDNYLPIRTWQDFEHSASKDEYLKDPLTHLFEGFALLRPGEQLWFQLLTEDAGSEWKKQGDQFIKETFGIADDKKGGGLLSELLSTAASIPKTIVADVMGWEDAGGDAGGDDGMKDMWKAFKVTEQEREVTKAVVKKLAKPGLKTKIRAIYIARKDVFSKVIRINIVKGALKQLEHQDGNKFGGANSPEDDYFWQVWRYASDQNSIMEGYVNRSTEIGATPFVLNTEELATLWHFPTMYSKVPLIKKTVAKRGEAPTDTPFASEAEEMLLAPTMNLPSGAPGGLDSVAFEQEVDIFTAPLSMPKKEGSNDVSIDAGTEPVASQETSFFPNVTSPTAGLQKEQVVSPQGLPVQGGSREVLSTERGLQKGDRDSVRTEVSLPSSRYDTTIPAGIRVLIEPGIEPEDVGIHANIEEDL